MILNAYSVLAIFVGLVELALGAWVVVLAARSLRRPTPGDVVPAASGEARLSLLLLLSFALLGTSVASWPLLYLLLSSYVPEWAGVMCIQGVVRVGTGSEGLAGCLPALVGVVQATKVALVFATGAWLALHLLDRATSTAPLARRVLALMLVAGAIAVVDASTQLAYVGIPKRERFLAQGCCTLPEGFGGSPAATLPFLAAADPATARSALTGAFYAVAGTMILVAWLGWRSAPVERAQARWRAAATLAGAAVGVAVATAFLKEIAAPVFLDQPGHRCAYCLVALSPLGIAAIVSFLGGSFAVGWAAVVDGLGRTPETSDVVPGSRRSLLRAGMFGYLMALALITVRMLAG